MNAREIPASQPPLGLDQAGVARSSAAMGTPFGEKTTRNWRSAYRFHTAALLTSDGNIRQGTGPCGRDGDNHDLRWRRPRSGGSPVVSELSRCMMTPIHDGCHGHHTTARVAARVEGTRKIASDGELREIAAAGAGFVDSSSR